MEIQTIDHWSGKIVGNSWRLSWGRGEWKLEELPAKGLKKLGVATMNTDLNMSQLNEGWRFIPENILRDLALSAEDTYETVKEKVLKAKTEAGQAVAAANPGGGMSWATSPKWWEDKVHYLKVTPEGVEKFIAEGKDFKVEVSWTTFSSYSPDSDLSLCDPYYSQIEATSAAAGRKLYQTLKKEPEALKDLSWSAFRDWLRDKKISFETHHSVWR